MATFKEYIEKANPYHDNRGRFATKQMGGGGGGAASGAELKTKTR